ncbi:hypothetical protein BOTBODRAFT_179831 [Botryobasidium botryosum FD-172 SS1]|uniref:Ubiquinol-cytochrome c chaperone domain-containing protein n=1 Tax=Botryobasidium botryosum (strain FD-172 SS1) TaxID=930990 RepID=A0A067LYZ7_BOTB1|nr:hypothetical protein BOTBODRAFT_179831 [Botryobasidium botryosum FD-172 SS1]
MSFLGLPRSRLLVAARRAPRLARTLAAATAPLPPPPPPRSTPASPPHQRAPPSPTSVAFVKTLAKLFGYNSKSSTAIRETRTLYALCKDREDAEADFFHQECRLPPTYQTWFQLTNLHIWLLTVRLRALPPPYGRLYIQELLNHFFLDAEDRMRAVLGEKVSERVIRGYMKEMRDQWAGSGASYDLGLVDGDQEMAGALWRNIFAAKGASVAAQGKGSAEVGQKSEDALDAHLPSLVLLFVAHLRREAKRLEQISDEDVLAGKVGHFGLIEREFGDLS